MKINFDVKREFIVNGKKYNSVEEMPPELRETYEKAMRSGAGVTIEKPQVHMETKIVFNGKEYESLEAMPEDMRRLYRSVMKSVDTGEASSDLLSAAFGSDSALLRPGRAIQTSQNLAKAIEPTSSIPRWIIAALMLLGFAFFLYYLFTR